MTLSETLKAMGMEGMGATAVAPRRRWLGLWWIGHPWPRRLRFVRSFPFVYVKRYRGCGCVAPAKSVAIRFDEWLDYTYGDWFARRALLWPSR